MRLVWVVDPERRTVVGYRAGGHVRLLRDGEILDGGEVLPGFQAEVGELFPFPPQGR